MFWECVCNKAFSDMASLHSSLTCLTVSFLFCFIAFLIPPTYFIAISVKGLPVDAIQKELNCEN